jgi:hypothetical protein
MARIIATSKRMEPAVQNDWVLYDCQAGSSAMMNKYVVEMISELPDPLNAGEKLSSYIDLLLATYPSVRGYLAPSELNIRNPS